MSQWYKKTDHYTDLYIVLFCSLHAGSTKIIPEFKTHILPLCVSFTVLSAFIFALGLFLGALCTKFIAQQIRQDSAPQTAHGHVPVYEEVPAYEEVPLQRAIGYVCNVENNIVYGVTDS